jgi:acyl carrier protein
MSTDTETKAKLRNWVQEQTKATPTPTVDDDTPIIEHRIISSLQVMDLILYIEQLRGRSIDVQNLTPGVFRDVNTIFDTFLREK